ncbi:uncharacterized protein F4822DRAFT_320837 [Hypoxylon trugodes]|uniref:uncharacterized protein n=1 Tax=Hypoxylon trugodes TaxID=326681 RepID=UPI0021933318|nr:uncharacterized protein F4822DRAFT_320837 [Hypoxylon trugodes]KAI1386587.1 hypothetical protein F4822DRAFT_320837 [Hypoxylon trugodes]
MNVADPSPVLRRVNCLALLLLALFYIPYSFLQSFFLLHPFYYKAINQSRNHQFAHQRIMGMYAPSSRSGTHSNRQQNAMPQG